MTKEEILAAAELMRRYEESKGTLKLEYRKKNHLNWKEVGSPVWIWDIYEYREKPKAKITKTFEKEVSMYQFPKDYISIDGLTDDEKESLCNKKGKLTFTYEVEE